MVTYTFSLTSHTGQASSHETPFSFVNGRDAKVPFGFLKLTMHESFVEIKWVRQLAKQNIEKAQRAQKQHLDKQSRSFTLTEGGLIMLKVKPKFKLDQDLTE